MGLRFSAAVLDASFYNSVEKAFIPQMHRYRFVAYFRYRDDSLVVSTVPGATHLFFKKLRELGKPFSGVVDEVARRGPKYLDLRISSAEQPVHCARRLEVHVEVRQTTLFP